MPPPPNLGLGPNDPNGNRRTAGTPFNASGASSNLGGLSFGKSDVDTSGLTDLSAKFKQISSDVAKLDTVLQKLVSTASKLSSIFGIRGGGSSSGASTGGGSLTTAVFSAAGSAGAGTVTAASFGSGPGGKSGNRNTPAPVGAFGGGQQGSGGILGGSNALPLMALGELGSQWAGQINTGMSNISQNGMGIDLQARQLSGGFGSTLPNIGQSANQMAQVPAMSQKDLTQAYSMIMQNPYLRSQPGSKNSKALQSFMRTTAGINPTQGASGAAQFANTLTSQPVESLLSKYGYAQQGKGLFNPMTQALSGNTNQVYGSLLKALTGQPNLTPKQAIALARNPERWAALQQNAQQQGLGLTATEMQDLWQFAGAGMSTSKAVAAVGGSGASAALGLGTAQTQSAQAAYGATEGTRNTITKAKEIGKGISRDIGENPVGGFLLSAGTVLGHAASAATSIAAKGAEGYAAVTALRHLGGGLLGGGGSGGPMPSGGTGQATPGGTAAAPLYVRSNPTMPLEVSISSDSLKQMCDCNSHPGTSKSKTSTKKKSGGGGILGDLEDGLKAVVTGTAIEKVLKYMSTHNPPGTGGGDGDVPEVPMGDPPTGNTTTAGMKPGLASRVSAMMAANPNLKITSGYRSPAQQAYLYSAKGGQGVAKVGQSAHQTGSAADLGPPSQFGWIAKNAGKYGLARPAPQSEPWHVQTMGDPATPATGSQAVSIAQGQLGVPYSWGAEAPGQGFDCSGLVQYVFSKIGISLPRTTYQQVKCGTAVNGIGSAQPGDLLFYAGSDGSPSNPGHVTIYIGGGKQIEAPYTGQVVQIDSVGSSGAGAVVAIRRVVKGGSGTAAVQAAQATVGAPSNDSHSGAGGASTSAMNSFISQVGANNNWDLTPGAGAAGPAAASTTTSSAATSSGSSAGAANSTTASAAPTAGDLSAQQVYQLALGAGLSKAAARTATAVAKQESNFNPQAIDHDSDGSTDYGLWQINSRNGGSTALFNAAANAAKMASMTNKGNSWGDWGPDFGEAGYGVNPPLSGLPGSKVAIAMAQLGTLGDPVGPSGSAPMSSMASGTGAVASVSMGGMSGGRGISIYMPVQVVGVSAQDAQNLAQMVLALLKQADGLSTVSEN